MTRASFEVQYQKYSAYVHAILIARLPPAQVEDAMQEVFLDAWRKIHQLHDHSSFGPWVAAIARNKANDFYRKRKPEQTLTDTHAAKSQEPDPILQALQLLPDTYRETLALRFVQGLTGPEIAALTGLTHGSVRVNLTRGLAMLREILGVNQNV